MALKIATAFALDGIIAMLVALVFGTAGKTEVAIWIAAIGELGCFVSIQIALIDWILEPEEQKQTEEDDDP